MGISATIRSLWHEVEDILTAATGPLLIVSSAVSTSDIFSNSTFSHLIPQLPAVWAIARALAVTMWLGVAFEYYLNARAKGESGFWWFALSAVLFAVDLQTATLFAFQAEHISNLGEWAALKIPPIDWAIEQAVLGVILIAVHRAVIHHAPRAAAPASVATAPSVAPRVATVAAHDPLLTYLPERPTWVSDEDSEGQEATKGVTRRTPRAIPSGRPRRGDSGGMSANRQARIAELVEMLRADPKLSLTQIMSRLKITKATAVDYRDHARDILAQEESNQV